MDSREIEPDLIFSSDGKEILYISDSERLEREKRLCDFFAFHLIDFLARMR